MNKGRNLFMAIVVTFGLAACGLPPVVATPSPDTPPPAPSDATPVPLPSPVVEPTEPAVEPAMEEAADTYEGPDGLFTVPIPTNWSAETIDDYGMLTGPDGNIRVYVMALEGADIEMAIVQAWERVDPEFELEPEQTLEPPATGGVEEVVVTTYDTGDEEVVQAVGQLHQGIVYVMLFRGDLVAIQQRSAQINIIQSGYQITALEEADLVGAEPLPVSGELAAELEAYIEELMQRFNIPGATVAVVQGDEIVYAQGFGVRTLDGEMEEPVTPDTRMMIGSTGKTLTTMLMAVLVDEGLMQWDTPAQAVLPEFEVADPTLSEQITMRNLVCACTGVPRRDYELLFNANELSAEDIVESLETFEFFTDFGEAFQYSNQMVAAGGYAAAAAAGGEWGSLFDAYADALQTYVLDPIGLPNTTLSFDEVRADEDYAIPHGLNLGFEYVPLDLEVEEMLLPVAPAGAHWSSAMDMGRYLITELNTGVAPDGTRVVSEENLQTTWEPQVPVSAETSYGLGWLVDDYKGLLLLHHGGNTTGFTSDLAFLPEMDLGISVLANAQGSNYFNEAIRYRLFELVFDLEPEFDEQVTFVYEQTRQQLSELAGRLLEEIDEAQVEPYLGNYQNEALGELSLRLQDGALVADIGEAQAELRRVAPEEGEEEEGLNYLVYEPPLAGLPFELTEDEAGSPLITLGSGVVEYVFERDE